jgi:hypothetical protein
MKPAGTKPFSGFQEGMMKLSAIRKGLFKNDGDREP